MVVARVGMIDSRVSGWDNAARYWSRGTAESDEAQVDAVVQPLRDRCDGLLADVATLEAEIVRLTAAPRSRSAELSGLRARTNPWMVHWYRRPMRVALAVLVTIVASASAAVLVHEETASGIAAAQVVTVAMPDIDAGAADGAGGRVGFTRTGTGQ